MECDSLVNERCLNMFLDAGAILLILGALAYLAKMTTHLVDKKD